MNITSFKNWSFVSRLSFIRRENLTNTVKVSAIGVVSISVCLLLIILFTSACKKDKKSTGTCSVSAVPPTGHLTYTNASGPYTFRTNGGGTIVINPAGGVTIIHDNYAGFKIELWGDTTVNGQTKTSANHENLNGKHIKDRLGARRTIIFPDGAKVTLIADGVNGPLISVSIYDGAESHRINPVCNTLESSSTILTTAQQLDNAEADGETGAIEFTASGLVFVNIYTENTVGNKVMNRYNLGEIFRNNPNMVNDHYDDARLGHT